jgi:hypothetical protein
VDLNIKFQVIYYSNGNSNITANYGGTDYQTIGSGKWQVNNINYNTVNNSVLSKDDKTTIVTINPNNLFENGYGQLNNNYNFSAFTYDRNNTKGSLGSFTKTSSINSSLFSDNYIPVDTSKQYIQSGWFKNNGTAAAYYVGFACYDIDKQVISANNVMYVANTTTTLTHDLRDGDTVVYLNDVSKFQVNSTTPTYRLGLIFWDYSDSTGYHYPIGTYSRKSWSDLYLYTSVNTSDNTITLKTAWSNGTILAGTSVSQSTSGGAYNYVLLANEQLTTDWQFKKATISGISTPWSDAGTSFRYGTKYIRFLSIDNYYNITDTTTWHSGLQFVEASKY